MGRNDSAGIVRMDKALKHAKLWKLRKDNKRYNSICNARDLRIFVKKLQYNAYIVNIEVSGDNTYLVLYKIISGIFSLNSDISCKNLEKVLPEDSSPALDAANFLVTNT